MIQYKRIALLAACMPLLAACNDFLDKTPDSRTELDTEDKITKLLVSGYPTKSFIAVAEFASDNMDDNGDRYTTFEKLSSDLFYWRDTQENENDDPADIWSASYKSIAVANQALQAIDQMGNPTSLRAQRGEALLIRAYNHFVLSYIFCQAWTEAGKDTDMGIPYATEPETTVHPYYDRGTIGQTYSRIEADLEEGLALISDEIFTVPKYHFNLKAAYAFAARFYLYYRKYQKAIDCANRVLGSDASTSLRDWEAIGQLSFDNNVQPDAYIDANSRANLLLTTARSYWGLYNGPLTTTNRYTHNQTIAKGETCMSKGVWDVGLSEGSSWMNYLKFKAANYTSIPKVVFRKFALMYMEWTNIATQSGYYNIVQAHFTTDETLLVRAEAYAMLKQYDKALADMTTWQHAFTTSTVPVTLDKVNSFYGSMAYYTPEKATPKKAFHTEFAIEPGTQENMLHYILHARRITTLHEGLRWGDIKRYGITIYRRIVANNKIQVVDELTARDPRCAIQLPTEVIGAGLPANPRN